MSPLGDLERIARDLIEAFDIQSPPIPVETMLQEPRTGMFESVDLNDASIGFFVTGDSSDYSPMMYMARLLARQLARSPWGIERRLEPLIQERNHLLAFARMIVMPLHMIEQLSEKSPSPEQLSSHFEVPLSEATARLNDLLVY